MWARRLDVCRCNERKLWNDGCCALVHCMGRLCVALITGARYLQLGRLVGSPAAPLPAHTQELSGHSTMAVSEMAHW